MSTKTSLNLDEQKQLVKDLGDNKQLLILKSCNLIWSNNTKLYYDVHLEQAYKIQISAQAGSKVSLPKPEVQDLVHQQAMKGFGSKLGEMEFAALKRRLSRLGSDYES